MQAKTILGKSTEEIKSVVDNLISEGYKPTLALVFTSIKLDINSICEILNDRDIKIYGTTTSGEISDNSTSTESVSIMLLDLDRDKFEIYLEEYESKTPIEAAKKIADDAKNTFPNPGFLIASSTFEINYNELLRGFKEVAGDNVNVCGGVAGDEINNTFGTVFTNNKISKSGIVAVAFDENKVSIGGRAFCGWEPLGTVKTVTKSEGNMIYEIDGENALDVTLRYAGIKELPEDYAEAIILVSRTLAMQFLRDKGDPITLVGIIDKEKGAFFVHQEVPVGTKLRFAVPPDYDVVDEVVGNLSEIKSDIPEADAVLLYSCGARIDILGPIMKEEIQAINGIWNAPMAGFFCNGELARANGGDLEIHNLTACCTVLKEK